MYHISENELINPAYIIKIRHRVHPGTDNCSIVITTCDGEKHTIEKPVPVASSIIEELTDTVRDINA